MEKYSQFRDKGSGIAPFFPIPRESSGVYLPLHIFLFICRVPLLLAMCLTYFLLFSWLPVGSLVKKAALWIILGIPGIWWIDLQIDGVKRGSLARNRNRLPQPGSVIASSFTSPVDCLYLAAIFNPVFTASYPNTRLVQPITLFQAIFRALSPPQLSPPPNARLVPLSTLIKEHADSLIVVLPECTTSNGRGILTFSPSLLTTPSSAKIYAVNLRYTPADVTTPVPGAYLSFLWDLCSIPTHLIRVRIAEAVQNNASGGSQIFEGFETVAPETEEESHGVSFSSAETLADDGEVRDVASGLAVEEKRLLDRVAEDLARLGRVKRVGLGVRQKVEFVRIWTKMRKIW